MLILVAFAISLLPLTFLPLALSSIEGDLFFLIPNRESERNAAH